MPDQLFRLDPSAHVAQIFDVLVAAPGVLGGQDAAAHDPQAAPTLNTGLDAGPTTGASTRQQPATSSAKEALVAHLAQLGADLDQERDTLVQLHTDISLRKQSRYLSKQARPPGTLASDFKNLSKAQQRLAAIGLFISLFSRPASSRDPFSWLSPEGDALRMLGKRSLGWSSADALVLWATWNLIECPSSYHQALATEFPLLVCEQVLPAVSAHAASSADTTHSQELCDRVRDYLTQVHAWFPAAGRGSDVEALRHRISVLGAGPALPDSVCDIREAFGSHARAALSQAGLLERHTTLLVHLASWDKGPANAASAAWTKTLRAHLAADPVHEHPEPATGSGTTVASLVDVGAYEVLVMLAEAALVSVDHTEEPWHSGIHWFPTGTRRLLWGTCAALGVALAAESAPEVAAEVSDSDVEKGSRPTPADGAGRDWALRAETALAKLAAFCLASTDRGRTRCDGTASAALAALRHAEGTRAMPVLRTVGTAALPQAVLTTLTQLRTAWEGGEKYSGPAVPTYDLGLAVAAPGAAHAGCEMTIGAAAESAELANAVTTLSVADGARLVFLDAENQVVDPRQVTKTAEQATAVRQATNALRNIEAAYDAEVARMTTLAAAEPLPSQMWQRHLVEHPISGVVAAGLLWEARTADGTVLVGLPAGTRDAATGASGTAALWCLESDFASTGEGLGSVGLRRVEVPTGAQVRLWHPATTASPASHRAWLRHFFRAPWPQSARQLASTSLAPELAQACAVVPEGSSGLSLDGDWAGVQGLVVSLNDVACGVASSWWDVPGGVWSAPEGTAELVLRLSAAAFRARVALVPAKSASASSPHSLTADTYLDSKGVGFGALRFDRKTPANRWEPVALAEVPAEVMAVTVAEFGQFLLCCLGPHVSMDYYLVPRTALKSAESLLEASVRSVLLVAAACSRAELVEAAASARVFSLAQSTQSAGLFGDPVGVALSQSPQALAASSAQRRGEVRPADMAGVTVEVVGPASGSGFARVTVNCLTGEVHTESAGHMAPPEGHSQDQGEDRPTVLASARTLSALLATHDKALLFFFSDMLPARP